MAAQEHVEKWKLWYWPGGMKMKGRGEFIRLMFEDAGVPYDDMGRLEGDEAVGKFVFQGGNKHWPVRAPPVIQKGDFVMCNTPAIMSYLGRQLGYAPKTDADQAHVDSLLAVVTDAIAEGRLAFHPKDFYKTHFIQVEESKPYIKQYAEERLPKYLSYFEAVLQHAGTGFCVGDSMTAADFAVFHYLCAAESQFPEHYAGIAAPLCHAFKERIANRPHLKAYLASDRCVPFEGNSMM